ncbi:hypothetical protein L1987_34286 [Smallanthus sonchifolius]|uniref:Uncharacterized protein n=1 Tax=Smallanthus sonchifolius TaxID=185202 RepID=A0ACB9HSP4_9ASTR|nr:hypothetical protein L1987_34286 [Smallanthus sonchifolius]
MVESKYVELDANGCWAVADQMLGPKEEMHLAIVLTAQVSEGICLQKWLKLNARPDFEAECQDFKRRRDNYEKLINMEWGKFWSSHLHRTSYDIDLDA